MVADEQPIDRKGVAAILATQRDFKVVAEATNDREAASLCRRHRADVLLVSIRLPSLSGMSGIAAVRAASPQTGIIALAERGAEGCIVLNPPRRAGLEIPITDGNHGSHTDCLQLAVSEGALGALRRDARIEDLFDAVRAVASGNAWYEAHTAAALRNRMAGGSTGPTNTLSARELDVAGLIADGRSNKEIAQSLRITEPTVKKHVGHILEKLRLQDRLQIGIYIVRNPLLLKNQEGAAR